MTFDITRASVWAGEIDVHPGALARQLAALHKAGVNLESAIVRPSASLPGTGVLFVAPLIGPQQTEAAVAVGLRKTTSIYSVRIAGPDHPGLLADVARILAESGLQITGLTAASIEGRSVHYLRFDRDADADRAVEVLGAALG